MRRAQIEATLWLLLFTLPATVAAADPRSSIQAIYDQADSALAQRDPARASRRFVADAHFFAQNGAPFNLSDYREMVEKQFPEARALAFGTKITNFSTELSTQGKRARVDVVIRCEMKVVDPKTHKISSKVVDSTLEEQWVYLSGKWRTILSYYLSEKTAVDGQESY